MKMLMRGIALSLGIMATHAQADQIVSVDGEDYLLSDLTKNCQNITGDPAAQIACFSALSQLIEGAPAETPDNTEAVQAAFEALRTLALYQDDESGLVITGSDCNVQIVYVANYFHISRRNISSVDLFTASFDASKVQFEQTLQIQGGQAPLLRVTLEPGAVGLMGGGVALESGPGSFEARAPGVPLADYANEVVGQLQMREGQTVDFVLIHPQRSNSGPDIWAAFETFVKTCRG